MSKSARSYLLGLLLLIYGGGTVASWIAVNEVKHGRDFASYYYAARVALDGEDPYDTAALGALARQERTRGSVHPFFYPPPFLLSMLWVEPFSLREAARIWFVANVGLAWLSVWALRRWLGASWLVLVGVLATLAPLPDNAKMGQANLLPVALSLLGLWRGSGLLVGAAAMAKMSPALYLVGWLGRRELRPFVVAGLSAIGLSLLALPVVSADEQRRFFLEILPGFSSGDYHGLKVEMTLPANHSVPDLWNQLWPGPDGHTLDPRAQMASSAVSGLLTLMLGLVAARTRGDPDPVRQAALFGAITVLMVITPVYTYEHHLSMMILPAVALGVAIEQGRLPRAGVILAALCYAAMAWPLFVLRAVQRAIPVEGVDWVLQESKFAGAFGMLLCCVWVALRPAKAAPLEPADPR